MEFWKKLETWWWFTFKNHVVKKGEVGGFKYVFRDLTLDIRTVSGNFKARWTADKDPFGMLLACKDEDDIHGYAATIYLVSKWLTADQDFVDAVQGAILAYQQKLDKEAQSEVEEDEVEEKMAIEEVKQVQEYVDATPKQRRKIERDANGRFKKAVKNVQKGSNSDV